MPLGVWSVGATTQGQALMALLAQEVTALGLPRMIGDGTYIVAPLIMGYFCDCDIMGDAIPSPA